MNCTGVVLQCTRNRSTPLPLNRPFCLLLIGTVEGDEKNQFAFPTQSSTSSELSVRLSVSLRASMSGSGTSRLNIGSVSVREAIFFAGSSLVNPLSFLDEELLTWKTSWKAASSHDPSKPIARVTNSFQIQRRDTFKPPARTRFGRINKLSESRLHYAGDATSSQFNRSDKMTLCILAAVENEYWIHDVATLLCIQCKHNILLNWY